MLSSPPPPAPPPHRDTHGDEPDQTQYSLDLDALNLDDEPSALDSPSVHRVVDKIHSDDIDGPTDFTVNLAKYFRGTPRKQPLPAWEEQQDLFDETSADFLTNSSPNPSPKFDRSTQSESGANDTTPRPDHGAFQDPRKNVLQPTVEDYYSELTPGRPTSANLASDPAQRRSYSTSRLRQSQNHRPSSPPTIESMRSIMSHYDSTPNQKPHSLYQELQKLRALNESLQTQLDTERASRQYQRSDRSQSRGRSEDENQLASLQNELKRMREESQNYQNRMRELRSDLEQSKANEKDAVKLAEDRAKELDQMHDSEDAEIHNLQVQLGQARDAERQTHSSLDKVKDELKAKDSLLADVESQLKQSQANLRETENDMQELKTWNEGQRKAKSTELERVQRELSEARREIQQAKDDQEEDVSVNRTKVDMDDEPQISQQQEELIASVQTQLENMRKAVDIKDKLIADLKSQIDDDLTSDNLRRQLQEAQDALEAKEKAVQSAHEDADTKAADMTRGLAQQLQQANQRLAAYETDKDHVKADATLSQLEAQLQKARDELNSALQQHTSDKAAWARANSEAQQSQANVYDQMKKEQDLRKKAHEEIRSLREELDILQQFDRIEDKAPSSARDISTQHLADSLRKDLQALRSQLESQQNQHHDEVTQLRKSWTSATPSLPQSDFAALQALRAEHRRTIDLIEEGMASLRVSRDTLSLRNNELSTTLSTTQAELQMTANSLMLAEADLAAKATELQALASASQELEQRLTTTTSELTETRAELSDLHATNIDFDTKLSATLNKREDSWRAKVKNLKDEVAALKAKIAELEAERKGMVKALMGFWGREEFGGDEEYDFVDDGKGKEGNSQKFRYKFAKA